MKLKMEFFIIQTVSKIKNALGAEILTSIENGSKRGASPVLAKGSPQRGAKNGRHIQVNVKLIN